MKFSRVRDDGEIQRTAFSLIHAAVTILLVDPLPLACISATNSVALR
jgi:hypothetical protein